MAMVIMPIAKEGTADGTLFLPMGKKLYSLFDIASCDVYLKDNNTEIKIINNSGIRQYEFINPIEMLNSCQIIIRSSNSLTRTIYALVEA